MSCVIKTNPRPLVQETAIGFVERYMFGGKDVRPEDVAFLWFTEDAGGNGLAAWGRIVEVRIYPPRHLTLMFRVERIYAGDPIGKDDLSPYRHINDGSPIAELAQKLYGQAHNKVAAISHQATDFLTARFTPHP